MKKVTLLCALFFAGWATNVHAQGNDNTDQYFNERGNFAQRLWYGGGFNLGFFGSGGNNVFSAGISPMVGYKITDDLSAGPRIGLNYLHVRGPAVRVDPDINGQVVSCCNPEGRGVLTFSGGLFARYKAFENFFGHIEIEFTEEQFFVEDGFGNLIYETGPDRLLTVQEFQENFYGGIGYTSGFPLGFEILLLYNFNLPENSFESPFDIRVGFNYNF